MAQQTDQQLATAIRTAISSVVLSNIETLEQVSIIINVHVKQTPTNAVYIKGGHGLQISDPNKDTEAIKTIW